MLTKKQADELAAKLRDVITQWDAWQPSPEQMVLYLGRGSKPMREAVKEVFVEVGEAFRTVEIQQSAWELTLAVDKAYSEFGRWIRDYETAPEAIPPHGSDELWEEVRALWTVVDRKRPPAPPHAIELKSQGCSLSTIAMRYGWYTSDGRADQARVSKELAAQVDRSRDIDDREYDPDTWVHPRERDFADQVQAAFQERCEKLSLELESVRPGMIDRKPCKESYEELAELPFMTYKQIAMMKRITEDEARQELTSLGYVKCPDGFRRAHETGRVPRGEREPEWLQQHDTHQELRTVDDRIVAIANDGITKPKNIADLLSGKHGIQITAQKVAQVLRRHKEKTEEAATA